MVDRRGSVFMFTGPSGSGKTTIGKTWASRRAERTVFVDHDTVRRLVVSGYVSRAKVHDDPALGEEGERQWITATRVCERIVETVVRDGMDAVVAAFRPPGQWMNCWQLLDEMSPMTVVLLARPEVLAARDAARLGAAKSGPASVARTAAYDWRAWTGRNVQFLDNSDMTLDEAVQHVTKLVKGMSCG